MPHMDKPTEFQTKLSNVRRWMRGNNHDAVLLCRRPNFSWITCGGRNYVNRATETGAGAVLVTADRVAVVSNNIESRRFVEEELAGLDIDPVSFPWHEPDKRAAVIEQFAGCTPPCDTDSDGVVEGALGAMRATLLAPEIDRQRAVGQIATRTAESACRALEPGWTEHDVVAHVHAMAAREGANTPVCLVAADQRIDQRRHPLPTDTVIRERAMVVVCVERAGLICSATRLVHFAPVTDELRRKHEAVCHIDATAIASTVVGRPLNDVFARIVEDYKAQGFADEWQLHHQGGAAGYQPRETVANPSEKATVQPSQAFAWNPSITGTKSEDTILTTDAGFEWITAPGQDWPTLEVDIAGQILPRAALLER